MFRRLVTTLMIFGLVAGCNGESPNNTPAASDASSTTSTDAAKTESTTANSEPSKPATSALPEADLETLLKRGKIVFLRCRSCHTLEQGEPHLTGPNLHALIGAEAGVKEGYAFSNALINSGVVWDQTSLDKWLESPSQFIAGNRMVFAGLPAPADRQALIAYLTTETK